MIGAGRNKIPNKDPPSSNVQIVSSEKVMAAGMSCRPEMRDCDNPDVISYMLQRMAKQDSYIHYLQNKITEHDSLFGENSCFRLHLGYEITRQRQAIDQLQLDVQHLVIRVEALKRNFIQAHINIRRLEEVISQANRQIDVLRRETELNKQRNEILAQRLDEMDGKVTTLLNLLRTTDIRSVE